MFYIKLSGLLGEIRGVETESQDWVEFVEWLEQCIEDAKKKAILLSLC